MLDGVPCHQTELKWFYLAFQEIRIIEGAAKFPKPASFNWQDNEVPSALILTHKER